MPVRSILKCLSFSVNTIGGRTPDFTMVYMQGIELNCYGQLSAGLFRSCNTRTLFIILMPHCEGAVIIVAVVV